MFALRGIIISLTVFVLVYCGVSVAVQLTWRKLRLREPRLSATRCADALFVFRMLPFISAIFVTAALAVPSFLIFEPHSIHEPVGVIPVALAVSALALVLVGAVKGIAALRRASRVIAAWTENAQMFPTENAVPLLRVSDDAPAMTAAGILRRRVLISDAAAALLTANELQVALRHEMAHVRRRDNLRRLLLECVAFPGMRGLEAAWLEAGELAADEGAVSTAEEALDLAGALIKLSRAIPLAPPVELTAALVHTPASLVAARVKRLVAWREEAAANCRSAIWCAISGAAAVLGLLVCYGHLLVHVHAASEWLVR
jgi:Zn-dependent protease with chaperone function